MIGLRQRGSDILVPPWPDLVIATGWRPGRIALWIGRQSQGLARLVGLGRRAGQIVYAARVTQAESNPRELIAAAFRELERNWSDDAAHRRFIGLCAAQGALDEAGKSYRAVRDADPARRDEATRRLNDVTNAALQQLMLARSARPERGRRMMWLMVGICGFVVIQAVLTLLRARSQ